jgi:hypothetical protein
MSNIVPIPLGGLSTSKHPSKIEFGMSPGLSNCHLDRGIIEVRHRLAAFGSRPGANAGDVFKGAGYGRFNVNATQRFALSGNPTSGGVIVRWRPNAGSGYQSTTSIPFNATSEQVQTALTDLAYFEPGEIVCSGGPWPVFPIFVTLKLRYGRSAQPVFELLSSTLNTGTLNITSEITGGLAEEFLVILQKNGETTDTAYQVSADGATWTQIATGIPSSNFYAIQQYQDKLYVGASNLGLAFKQLGGKWSGQVGVTPFEDPTAKPTSVALEQSILTSWIGASSGGFNGWPANPTVSFSDMTCEFTVNTTSITNRKVSVVITLSSDLNLGFTDLLVPLITIPNTGNAVDENSIQVILTSSDAIPIDTEAYRYADAKLDPSATFLAYRAHLFNQASRANRAKTRKIKLSFYVKYASIGSKIRFLLQQCYNYINDRAETVSFQKATSKPITYAYSYYRASDGAESKLSLAADSPAVPSGPILFQTYPWRGAWVQVTAPGSTALTTSDYVFLYRKDEYGRWRRVASVQNNPAGNVIFTDKFTLDDLDSAPFASLTKLPGGFRPDCLGNFKQALVVGADYKTWISQVGGPLVFAPDPESGQTFLSETIDRPRTVFLSQDRADTPSLVIGGDSLFLVGEDATYVMVGDLPSEASPPRRLPNSKGTRSPRGATPFGSGVLVGSTDALWYYGVGRTFTGDDTGAMQAEEVTADVRSSWQSLIGNSPQTVALVVHELDKWAFNGTSYLCLTRNGAFIAGAFPVSIRAAMSIPTRGLIACDSTGKLYKIAQTQTTDFGASVSWSYQTSIMDVSRGQLKSILVMATGSPTIKARSFKNGSQYEEVTIAAKFSGQVQRLPINLPPGFRFQFVLSGSENDSVEYLAVELEQRPGGKGN